MPYDHRKTPLRTRALLRGPALALAAAGCCAALAGCGASQASPSDGRSTRGAEDAPTAATPSGGPDGAGTPAASPGAAGASLAGRTVVLDPGHNPGNFRHAKEINQKVNIGTNRKECDTTGTSTNAGYTEAAFTLDVTHRLRDLLTARGAEVVLTHDADRPWGPCIDERAKIGNAARADAVVSVHADGSAVGHRGFHVILPARVREGAADTAKIVGPSRELGERIADRFARATGTAPSNYLGSDTGLDVRDDLGGLNLSTVPKVFVECGNMRDPKDAELLTSAAWRQKAAQGMADGIATYLRG
ncbi:N-acetylmuramoyl-L-alanine amidase [Streptomyces sp. adm13(2018)]|uniref:N-acetylmuramoyl-L-alanine amidase n=1 Tax=Streptomyces sp. adm13(2018) TaxID=2479007 RepID=UPI0011CE8816|nr:N-acetylmuramoyl-L-alanine amidase [Streptomyces sp. adm13(2018)]TXS13999.1 N-acetylmuramoyl-L-alanine amidase [Streptomyces sp. adm13(2018)]